MSPQAGVSQTIGVTDISVSYHRPAVNERDIWGALVPYGQVWRTGANENTMISFSTDVMVEGQALAAGSYGLHTQPGEQDWEIIFSNDTEAWGSFAYDADQDALRVKVKPETADFQETLGFSFDDPGSDEVTLALRPTLLGGRRLRLRKWCRTRLGEIGSQAGEKTFVSRGITQ